jgi:hypothetical protein
MHLPTLLLLSLPLLALTSPFSRNVTNHTTGPHRPFPRPPSPIVHELSNSTLLNKTPESIPPEQEVLREENYLKRIVDLQQLRIRRGTQEKIIAFLMSGTLKRDIGEREGAEEAAGWNGTEVVESET